MGDEASGSCAKLRIYEKQLGLGAAFASHQAPNPEGAFAEMSYHYL